MDILKSFYAKVWNERNTYYIKYKYCYKRNDDIYYKAQLELNNQKVPENCNVAKISVYIGIGESNDSIPSILKECHSLGIWKKNRSKTSYHVYYEPYNNGDNGYTEILKYDFKYLGEFKDIDDPEEVKLLIECGVEG